jgi:hypothetical protein
MLLTTAEHIPTPGVVTATALNGFHCSVATDGDGNFTMFLPFPGTYALVGRSPNFNNGTTDCNGSAGGGISGAGPIRVRPPPNVVHVTVLCIGF